MAKTYIGVDIDRSRLHIVCLEQGADGLFVRAIASREITGIDQAAEAVAEIVAAWGVVTTRMAAALPFDQLFSRTVTFPFSDSRKVAAAAPLALAAQLPIDLDNYLTTVLPTGRDGDLFRAVVLAVPEAEVAQFLEAFDRQQLPLRVLDIVPFADLQVLSQETPDAILVTIREGGYVVARSAAGVMQSYRQSIIPETMTDDALADAVLRDTQVVIAPLMGKKPPVLLVGAGLTAQRQRALIDRLPGATVPEAKFESGRLSAEYLPALALAHRATTPNSKACCNLRRGRYAYRGSLAPFRRQLIAIAILLTLTLVTAASGFWFGFARKSGELAHLESALRAIYSQSFPNSPIPADVPLYMASNLAGLHEESQSLGAAQIGPLQALDALTAGISDVGIDVQRFDFDVDGVALHGRVDSFDGVDQLAARLRQQQIFAQVQIGDAKTSIDGSRVEFRVDIDFSAAGGDR